MDDLDSIKKNAGIAESPVTELPQEQRDMLAGDFKKLAAEAMNVANALHKHDKKEYANHWEELQYYMLRLQKQVGQFK